MSVIKTKSLMSSCFLLLFVFGVFNPVENMKRVLETFDWQVGAQITAKGCYFLDDNHLPTGSEIGGGSHSSDVEECGNRCDKTPLCTHFTWETYNGGTCWLHSGSVSKSDALMSNHPLSVCGITKQALASGALKSGG